MATDRPSRPARPTAAVYRRRRLVAAAVAAGLVVLPVSVLRGGGGEPDGPQRAAAAAGEAGGEPRPPAELPRGGRRLFPDWRVVAYYGAPQDPQLGVLGIGSPRRASRRLREVARRFARPGRPALPAFELLATIAAAHPGEDGGYRIRQSPEVIDRYLREARHAKALLLLDVQPGRSSFMEEVRRLEPWLREPDVGLALDPEWHVGPGEVPGRVLGSVTAEEIDEVSAWLAGIVREERLPEKLLVIHQFTEDMVQDKLRVRAREGLAITFNVDGFGDRANKLAKYRGFTSGPGAARFHDGFKLFYEEDEGLMSSREVLALRPPPDLVVYE